MAILIHKTGKDLENSDSIAPSEEYKGVQPAVLTEGRYYYNPYNWAWTVVPQIEIPAGKLGVRIRLYGENLPTGELIAFKESQKGIVPEVLYPGRYAINAQLVDPAAKKDGIAPQRLCRDHRIARSGDDSRRLQGREDAGFRAAAREANEVVVPKGKETRGVQTETLEPGTQYLNPYVTDVSLIDCRSQRYNLEDIGFSTRDGFWVSLEGIIEFRVNPKEAAKVFVLYNEGKNNAATDDEAIQKMVIEKIIVPNARAYTRLKGSSHSGKEFITGDTRATFQEDFQHEMQETCAEQGIEVIQALITTIKPPEKIAVPVRQRQIALQQEKQYTKEIVQQAAEQDLAVQKATVLQKQAEVAAEQEVVVVTVNAKLKQEVAIIDANKRLGVAEKKFEAAKDLAAATLAKGKAEADVIRFQNEAQAAGWQKSIEAFAGDGMEFARYTLLKKIAPAYKAMMVNTDNSALMDVFKAFKTNNFAQARKPSKPARRKAQNKGTQIMRKICCFADFPGRRGPHRLRDIRVDREPRLRPRRQEPATALQGTVDLYLAGEKGRDRPVRRRVQRRNGRAGTAPRAGPALLLPDLVGTQPRGRRGGAYRRNRLPQQHAGRRGRGPQGGAVPRARRHRPYEQKGTLRRILGPGRYRINPYAYQANIVKTVVTEAGKNQLKHSGWVQIPAGYVGVQTYLTDDPVQPSRRAGIQDDVLPPGLYAINPKERQIDIVSIGYDAKDISTEKQKDDNGKIVVDESGEGMPVPDTGISFPSSDGFKIHMDFSVVWGVLPEQCPDMIRRFGDLAAVEQKIIIPQCESICRNNGSRMGAVELLVGDSRQKFQEDVDAAFKKVLKEKNLTLLYGLVRHIYIPKDVREPIQKGYIADELTLTREQETKTAKTEANLREAEQKVLLEAAKITEETKKLVANVKATGQQTAEQMQADTERKMATVDRQAAEIDAQRVVTLGEAEAQAKKLQQQAKAELSAWP